MDDLKNIEAIGFTIPSPAYLFWVIIFSVLGFAAYRYGKRASLGVPKWIGVAMMLYPYIVSETWLLYVVGAGLCISLYIYRR